MNLSIIKLTIFEMKLKKKKKRLKQFCRAYIFRLDSNF